MASAPCRRWAFIGSFTLLCAIVALPAASRADTALWRNMADPVFQPIPQESDLPVLVVPWVFAEDAQGFLWAGGAEGLLRWDGYRFRAYADTGTPPDGLADHDILALHLDRAGRLWAGTEAGGLARYDPVQDRFISIALPGPARRVADMEDDGAGGLWVAADAGLFHLDAQGHILKLPPATASGCFPLANLHAVRQDGQGRLWIGSANGLARFDPGAACFRPALLPGAASPAVNYLLRDAAGRLWIGTPTQGAFVITRGAMVPRQVPPLAGAALTGVTALAEVEPGRIWIGTRGSGIIEVDADTLHGRAIRRDPSVPESLPSDSVYGLARGRSGIVWVGTIRGLCRHVTGDGGILSLFGSAGRPNRLTDESVWSLASLPDGRIWAGLESNGLDIIDPAQARVTSYPGLAGHSVVAIQPVASGGALIATVDGLYSADAQAAHVRPLTIQGRPAGAGLLALRVVGGTVWVGGAQDGAWQLRLPNPDPALDPRASVPVQVVSHIPAAQLTSGTVRSIEPAPGGLIALGTDTGLDLLNPGTGAIEHIRPDPADPQAMGGGHVISMATDPQGRLWIGTSSDGIDVLLHRDPGGRPRFRRLGAADGLPNPDIDKIVADPQGQMWVATDNGLAVIDPSTFAIRGLRRADGVAILAYWSNAGTATPQGDLLFGGVGGITVVGAQTRPVAAPPPKVTIIEIHVGGRPVPVSLWHTASAPGPVISVHPNANSLAVEFSALDYAAPASTRYRYRLVGFDPDWVETDAAHRVATYTNLPPGNYTLLLSAALRDGGWTIHPTQLAISVIAAWYQTTAFRLCAVVLAAAALAGLFHRRTLVLRQRQRELERQVAERTAELAASQSKLEQFAYFDLLTGLPNRHAFINAFESLLAIATRQGQGCALLLVDLDGFKQVNDSLGHQSGDDVLVIAAGRLRQAVRDSDFVARLGGDEFAILLDSTGGEGGIDTICERVVAGMAVPMAVKGAAVSVGASLGAALCPAHGTTQDDLYRHADLALYAAKRAGRGGWRWYTQAAPDGADRTA